MPKKLLLALLLMQLSCLFSHSYAQSNQTRVFLGDTVGYYATTQLSDPPFAQRILDGLVPLAERKSTQELMIIAAKQMFETPYVAATLEGGDKEELRVFLHKTDCILFVETCFNLALCAKSYGANADFAKFANLVRKTRYRDGVVENYSDRIHYTTEWIRQCEKRGLVKDITQEIGGVVYDHPIFYMSKNYNRYAALKDARDGNTAHKDLVTISKVEQELNSEPFYYIPKADIQKIEDKIQSGDIICYMSGVQGLDIAHVAMAYVDRGKVGFIHASMGAMKVITDPKSIHQYANSSKNITGIKVIRPL